ncbi:hypothetical protein SteCoe_2522 [Stentor coeruleus]|uniref:DOMON domain-containing protein n=1 Tax=Stentor coeruleus TaxID=5963 RepID=A0A1R2CZ97_9CILI|nr:hypothetical protein SteCoe_2522 [Stentor coeruleus]
MILISFLLFLTSAQDAIVDLDDKMQLGWSFDDEEIIFYFVCQVGDTGYCGIGFGLDMYNVDMIWAIDSGTLIRVTDGWSEDRVMPDPDIYFSGGTSDLTNIETNSENGVLTVNFRRMLNTGDKYDFILSKDLKLDLCFAYYYTSDFIYHEQNYGSGSLVLSSDQANAKFDLYSKYYKPGYEKHSILMSIMWIALSSISIILARYFKWWWPWVYFHVIFYTIVLFFTIYSVTKVIITNENMLYTYTSSQKYHSRIGLTISALIIGQYMLGILSRVLIYFNLTETPITVIRKAHYYLGWVLHITCLFNAFIGWEMYNSDFLKVIITSYVVLIVVFILFEFWNKVYPIITNLKVRFYDSNNDYRILRFNESYSTIFKRIHREKLDYVFYDNYLLNVRNFMSSHSGGAFMIKKIIGEDAGKYLNGSSTLPGFGINYHDLSAFTIAKSLAIADLGYENTVLTGNASQERMVWEVADKFKVCESTYCISLHSDEWNVNRPTGFDWMGKCFLLTMSELTQTKRYYTLVLTNINNWDDSSTKNIKLYIKPYTKGKVSKYITSLNIGEKVILKGPMGPGLMLDNIKKGKYLAFAGGTGILPFIDLVQAIWYNEVPEGFMLYVYVSFSSENDVFAMELFEATAEKYPEKFCYVLYVKSKSKENIINLEKVREWKENIGKLRKVWVCGKAGFSGFIRDMLKSAEVPMKKIINL